MSQITLLKRADGKVSLTLSTNGLDIIRIPDSNVEPYSRGTQRAAAWDVIRFMDGLTVQEGNDILAKLEPNIQGTVGRPLGWIVDAVDRKAAEIHLGEPPTRKGTKTCPAPGCGHEFKGFGWDGIDAHWKAKHEDLCSYSNFWAMLKNMEASVQPARQRKITEHACELCGKSFSGVRQARFCSDKCRYDAANRRRRSGA